MRRAIKSAFAAPRAVRLEKGGKQMYAIVKTGGKQHKVEQGKYFFAEKVSANVGDKIELPVLLVADDAGKVVVGNPIVKNAKVVAEVLAHGKDSKIVVYKYKPKKNERKKQGHRQPFTKLNVVSIEIK